MRALPVFLLLALTAASEDLGRPRHNTSYVPDDDPSTRALVGEAVHAAMTGTPAAAAERLQVLLHGAPGGLVPLRDGLVFVSPRRWAHLVLVGGPAPFGPEVLAAWRDVHDREASALLRGAIAAGDEDEVLRLLDRYPAATAAPTALLALADRAIQRADGDAAFGYVLRVPEHLAPAETRAFLDAAPYRSRRAYVDALPRRRPEGWPTSGGDATRARNGDALGEGLVRLWETPFLEEVPSALDPLWEGPASARSRSPELPFTAVCDDTHLYVALGPCVAAIERTKGKLDYFAPEGSFPDSDQVDRMVNRNPGPRGATVQDGVLYFPRVLFAGDEPLRRGSLVAFDVKKQRTLWQVPRPGTTTELWSRPVFFRGAPAVADGRLYAYAAVREEGETGPTRKEEAYVVCLDAADGSLLWQRFLGYGTTPASHRFPPLSGLAPALSGGVVVAVTGLGVAASLDARTGDILWLFRYDRSRIRERERLHQDTDEVTVHMDEGWKREEPRIAGDTVYFAPFDSDEMYACWIRGVRGRDAGTYVEQWAKSRDRGHGRHSGLEYVAGFAHGRVYYVGRRDEREEFEESYKPVIAHPMDRTDGWSCGLIPASLRDGDTGRMVAPEPYGRPILAGDVLLVPTRETVFRFDVARGPVERLVDGELRREVPYRTPFPTAPEPAAEDGDRPVSFGNLVALDGYLYAVTGDRVICYGAK